MATLSSSVTASRSTMPCARAQASPACQQRGADVLALGRVGHHDGEFHAPVAARLQAQVADEAAGAVLGRRDGHEALAMLVVHDRVRPRLGR